MTATMIDNKKPWGATAEEWSLFANTLGLKTDLLPVVSRPDALIAKNSTLALLGKTPSTYNNAGQVVGILKWTERQASDTDLNRWKSHSDHGICVQTRLVRAIDIDIEDAAVAQCVRDVIELTLDLQLPRRWRADSGKCLLVFRMPGVFTKRIIRGDHGIVEFLGNKQQFVACGTHPKGQRYQWDPKGGPEEIPELTQDQFEEVWRVLADRFAIEPVATGRGVGQRPLSDRRAADVNDPVVERIETRGLRKSWTRDGRMNIVCPWEAEHTSDSGETATQWFPAGLGGFDKGNFRCLHAHCEHRTREEFFEAIGYGEDLAESFEVIEAAPGEVQALPKPVYQRKRNGAILGNIVNLRLALRRPDISLRRLAYDSFRAEIVVADWSEGTGEHELQWRPFTDTDYGRLKHHLEGACAFETVAMETLRVAVHMVAEDQRMDSAIEWLRHRIPPWDGLPRIDRFFSTYLGAADSPYTRAVGAYTWTALAGRVLEPGCKADMVPVLRSEEGTGKSTGVELMVPAPEHYVEIDLTKRDDDLSRSMRGKLIGELGELRGLQTRDEESIRAWVTRKFEEWTPKYREFAVKFPRRLLFIGTTNSTEFLPNDGSKARRWLPLEVGMTSFEALAADRDQLWAEARERFLAGGVEWRVVAALAGEVREAHRVVDDWQQAIETWLSLGPMDEANGEPRGASPVTTADVLTGAIGIPVKGISRKEQERAARILKALGYERRKARVRGESLWAFCPTSACKFLRVHHVLDLA